MGTWKNHWYTLCWVSSGVSCGSLVNSSPLPPTPTRHLSAKSAKSSPALTCTCRGCQKKNVGPWLCIIKPAPLYMSLMHCKICPVIITSEKSQFYHGAKPMLDISEAGLDLGCHKVLTGLLPITACSESHSCFNPAWPAQLFFDKICSLCHWVNTMIALRTQKVHCTSKDLVWANNAWLCKRLAFRQVNSIDDSTYTFTKLFWISHLLHESSPQQDKKSMIPGISHVTRGCPTSMLNPDSHPHQPGISQHYKCTVAKEY